MPVTTSTMSSSIAGQRVEVGENVTSAGSRDVTDAVLEGWMLYEIEELMMLASMLITATSHGSIKLRVNTTSSVADPEIAVIVMVIV